MDGATRPEVHRTLDRRYSIPSNSMRSVSSCYYQPSPSYETYDENSAYSTSNSELWSQPTVSSQMSLESGSTRLHDPTVDDDKIVLSVRGTLEIPRERLSGFSADGCEPNMILNPSHVQNKRVHDPSLRLTSLHLSEYTSDTEPDPDPTTLNALSEDTATKASSKPEGRNCVFPCCVAWVITFAIVVGVAIYERLIGDNYSLYVAGGVMFLLIFGGVFFVIDLIKAVKRW